MKKQKGITLIALIITIIAMLILVGVSVTVALNGGLFSTAKQATSKTQLELDKEQLLSAVIGAIDNNGKVDFDVLDNNLPEGFTKTEEHTYTSKAGNTFIVSENGAITLVGQTEGESGGEDSVVTVPSTYKTSIEGLADGVSLITYENLETEVSTEIKEAVDEGKISAVIKEGETIAVLPTGFEVSTEDGEDSISGGLVISDTNGNEFVWIPVAEELGSSYSYSSSCSEPEELTDTYSYSEAAYDSQATLDYLYGEGYYNYEEDFNYIEEYEEMATSINEYGGFYIGRYETTIDESENIGSEYNTKVLTAETTYTNNSTTYYYRWYGLYYAQKNANVSGNGETVQTAMIYGVLWDKTMDYIREQKTAGKTTYDVDTATATWHGSANGHTRVVKSGQANSGDVALNIWDLESNAREWTQEAYTEKWRNDRGGSFSYAYASSRRNSNVPCQPAGVYGNLSSRLVLFIK